jgi:hypothetical protein
MSADNGISEFTELMCFYTHTAWQMEKQRKRKIMIEQNVSQSCSYEFKLQIIQVTFLHNFV